MNLLFSIKYLMINKKIYKNKKYNKIKNFVQSNVNFRKKFEQLYCLHLFLLCHHN